MATYVNGVGNTKYGTIRPKRKIKGKTIPLPKGKGLPTPIGGGMLKPVGVKKRTTPVTKKVS